MAFLDVIRKQVAGRPLYYIKDEEKADAYKRLSGGRGSIGPLARERLEVLGIRFRVWRQNKSSLKRMEEDDTGAHARQRQREKDLAQEEKRMDGASSDHEDPRPWAREEELNPEQEGQSDETRPGGH